MKRMAKIGAGIHYHLLLFNIKATKVGKPYVRSIVSSLLIINDTTILTKKAKKGAASYSTTMKTIPERFHFVFHLPKSCRLMSMVEQRGKSGMLLEILQFGVPFAIA